MIQVDAGGLVSSFSPPLVYTHGQPYCGDGLIQGSVTFLSFISYISPLLYLFTQTALDGAFALLYDGEPIFYQTLLGIIVHTSVTDSSAKRKQKYQEELESKGDPYFSFLMCLMTKK